MVQIVSLVRAAALWRWQTSIDIRCYQSTGQTDIRAPSRRLQLEASASVNGWPDSGAIFFDHVVRSIDI